MNIYVKAFRIIYNELKSANANVNVYNSIDQEWNRRIKFTPHIAVKIPCAAVIIKGNRPRRGRIGTDIVHIHVINHLFDPKLLQLSVGRLRQIRQDPLDTGIMEVKMKEYKRDRKSSGKEIVLTAVTGILLAVCCVFLCPYMTLCAKAAGRPVAISSNLWLSNPSFSLMPELLQLCYYSRCPAPRCRASGRQL